MKNTILLLTFFASILFSTLDVQDEREKSNYLSVGIGALSFLHPITPSINFHIEKSIRAKSTLDLAYGIDVPKSTFLKSNLFEVNDNGRHHIGKLAAKFFLHDVLDSGYYVNTYFGLELFHVWNKYTRTSKFFESAGILYKYDSALISRNIRGVRIKSGLMQSFGKFELELYGGAGIKQVDVKYDTENQTIMDPGGYFPSLISPYDGREGQRFSIDLNVGVKMSFRING